MKFAFYGDSWVYHWAHSSDVKVLSKAYQEKYKIEGDKVLPDEATFLYGEMLRSMGHQAINFGTPCSPLEYTVRDIEEKHDPSADFHVVFVSAILRELSHNNTFWGRVPLDIRKDHDKFIEFYENSQLRLIWKLNRLAEEKNLRILLIGGHGPITETSAQATNKLVTVVSKDILKELTILRLPQLENRHDFKYINHFRFSTDIDFNDFTKQGWSKDIVRRMVSDIQQTINLDGYNQKEVPVFYNLLYPDGGHPNATTQIWVLNEILKVAEKIYAERSVV